MSRDILGISCRYIPRISSAVTNFVSFFSGAPDMMNGHKSRVFCVCFNPTSNHELVSGGWDDTIQFWDVRQSFALRHITGVHICGEGIDISSDGKQVTMF